MKKKPPAMEWLWAPWRVPYLKKVTKSDEPEGCFFCDYVRAPRKDRTNLVLLRGKTVFCVLNRYPYTGGHLMVAPLAHKGELQSLGSEERAEMMDMAVTTQAALQKVLRPQGFNLGMNLGRPAGAGVPGHVHFHVVPRWNGDTNFMTTAGNVRVIPQALLEIYDELKAVL